MPRPSLFLIALSLPLAACMGTDNRGLESVHQPVVERADYLLDLRTEGGALAPGEDVRLADWFDAMRLGYGDRVAVNDPDGYQSNARAAIGGLVAGYGLLVADVGPFGGAPVPAGAVRVAVSRTRASVPGCPDWSRSGETDLDNRTSSNHGCATNRNLAAMIADPTDLVRGRTGAAGSDPSISAKAIEAYRKQPATGANGLPGGVTSVSVAK